jgi:hypothetical protein
MDQLLATISKNPFREECVARYTKEKEELRKLVPKEYLWGGGIRNLTPSRLTTAWLTLEDPLMILAGAGYRQTEVRDHTFALQQEAASNLKGNRKLPKAKVAEALACLRPTEDQSKIVAAVLLALKQIQTVCFNEEKKTVWTMPEDFRAWSPGYKTLWVDAKCEKMLEFDETAEPKLGHWLEEREREGWTIPWPQAEGTLEELKAKMQEEFSHIHVAPGEVGKKVRKEDFMRVVGRCEAVRHLTKKEE